MQSWRYKCDNTMCCIDKSFLRILIRLCIYMYMYVYSLSTAISMGQLRLSEQEFGDGDDGSSLLGLGLSHTCNIQPGRLIQTWTRPTVVCSQGSQHQFVCSSTYRHSGRWFEVWVYTICLPLCTNTVRTPSHYIQYSLKTSLLYPNYRVRLCFGSTCTM